MLRGEDGEAESVGAFPSALTEQQREYAAGRGAHRGMKIGIWLEGLEFSTHHKLLQVLYKQCGIVAVRVRGCSSPLVANIGAGLLSLLPVIYEVQPPLQVFQSTAS